MVKRRYAGRKNVGKICFCGKLPPLIKTLIWCNFLPYSYFLFLTLNPSIHSTLLTLLLVYYIWYLPWYPSMGSITNTTAAIIYIKDYKLADTNQNSSPTVILNLSQWRSSSGKRQEELPIDKISVRIISAKIVQGSGRPTPTVHSRNLEKRYNPPPLLWRGINFKLEQTKNSHSWKWKWAGTLRGTWNSEYSGKRDSNWSTSEKEVPTHPATYAQYHQESWTAWRNSPIAKQNLPKKGGQRLTQ